MGSKSILLIISGPAGSGKNTVAERLMSAFPSSIERVITSTSRPPRGQEKDGLDYHFLSKEEFEKGIARGDFYDYAKVHDRYYGTSKSAVRKAWENDKDLILIIDVQGAKTWKKIAESDGELAQRMLRVFIAPASIAELRERLAGRGTESQSEIDRRMLTAESELKSADEFDARINSTTREADFEALKNIYLAKKASI